MSESDNLSLIKSAIAVHENFPKPGIIFRDVLPIAKNSDLCRRCVNLFSNYISNLKEKVTAIVGIEARGFIFGPLIANQLNIGFIPIRKKGKLPGATHSFTYTLEYGQDTIELSQNALSTSDVVVIFDDLLATGGTMSAAEHLIETSGARVASCCVIIELVDLHGRKKLKSSVHSLFQLQEAL